MQSWLLSQNYFNPRSPRGERLNHAAESGKGDRISIHAPREGSDEAAIRIRPKNQYFNPRSPRGERLMICTSFNPNRSYFNPRSPRGERRIVDPVRLI